MNTLHEPRHINLVVFKTKNLSFGYGGGDRDHTGHMIKSSLGKRINHGIMIFTNPRWCCEKTNLAAPKVEIPTYLTKYMIFLLEAAQ